MDGEIEMEVKRNEPQKQRFADFGFPRRDDDMKKAILFYRRLRLYLFNSRTR